MKEVFWLIPGIKNVLVAQHLSSHGEYIQDQTNRQTSGNSLELNLLIVTQKHLSFSGPQCTKVFVAETREVGGARRWQQPRCGAQGLNSLALLVRRWPGLQGVGGHQPQDGLKPLLCFLVYFQSAKRRASDHGIGILGSSWQLPFWTLWGFQESLGTI